jgi:hypothetical protein
MHLLFYPQEPEPMSLAIQSDQQRQAGFAGLLTLLVFLRGKLSVLQLSEAEFASDPDVGILQ